VEVLSGRVLITPSDPDASRHFYGTVLGLAIAREFGPPEHPGTVYFLGGGFLEISGQAPGAAGANRGVRLWMQVRDVRAEYERLRAAGASVRRPPVQEPWGLIEMWLEDPDGIAIAVVEVPADHPLRRDTRPLPSEDPS
jgi:predicted enzyme related to lactoylglutathione lyase